MYFFPVETSLHKCRVTDNIGQNIFIHNFTQCCIVCVCVFVAFSSQTSGTRSNFHPQLVSEREMSVMASKAHLVLRMIQLKIGHDLLLQVSTCICSTKDFFNKYTVDI